MLQPEILSQEQAIPPILRLAFRPFFLLPSMFSVLAITIWLLVLTGELSWQSPFIAKLWHGHEMIFGFTAAIAVGFLLTAAQTWTGIRSIKGAGLALLVVQWLAARVLFLIPDSSYFLLASAMQMTWWLIAIGFLAYMVIKANNKRNLVFVTLLMVMMSLNMTVLVLSGVGMFTYVSHILYAAVIAMTLVITVLGGRVIPFFTLKALNLTAVKTFKWLEKILPVVMVLTLVLFLIQPVVLSPVIAGSIFIIAGILQLARVFGWQQKAAYKVPLLWSLHLSYLNLALGLILVGISYFTHWVRLSDAIHIITLGAIGTMILAMMARVSLGHTGRALQISRFISFAFMFMLIATWCRLLMPVFGWVIAGYSLSALGWIIAFSLYIYFYLPILLTARPDGRSG